MNLLFCTNRLFLAKEITLLTACKDLQNIRYVGVFIQVGFDSRYFQAFFASYAIPEVVRAHDPDFLSRFVSPLKFYLEPMPHQ